jgi:hypothetical protein
MFSRHSLYLPHSLVKLYLATITEPPVRAILIRHAFYGRQFAMVWLNTFSARGGVRQMKYRSHPLNLRAMRAHLGGAAAVTPDAMP